MKNSLKHEINLFFQALGSLKTKNIIIFISIPLLATLSWYFASPEFYNKFFSSNSYASNNIHKIIPVLYWFGLDTLLYLIFPILIIIFVFRDSIKNFGFRIGTGKTGLTYLLLSIIIILPTIYFSAQSKEFTDVYPILKAGRSDWTVFIIFEALLLFYIASWEFMWRGYVLFGLEKDFGYYAVLIQAIPFVILHNGKPFFETFGAIFGGIFLGYLALRTRSFYYGVFIHFSLISLLDFISVLKFRIAENIGIF